MSEQLPSSAYEAARRREEAQLAKADLQLTVSEIKERLQPSHLAKKASDAMSDEAANRANKARTQMQKRPLVTGFAAALLSILVLGKLRKRKSERNRHDKR